MTRTHRGGKPGATCAANSFRIVAAVADSGNGPGRKRSSVADQHRRRPCFDPAGRLRLRSLRPRVAIAARDDERDETVHRLLNDVRRRGVRILEPALESKRVRETIEHRDTRSERGRALEQLAP